jgi:hypothetical protein
MDILSILVEMRKLSAALENAVSGAPAAQILRTIQKLTNDIHETNEKLNEARAEHVKLTGLFDELSQFAPPCPLFPQGGPNYRAAKSDFDDATKSAATLSG